MWPIIIVIRFNSEILLRQSFFITLYMIISWFGPGYHKVVRFGENVWKNVKNNGVDDNNCL